MKTSEPTQSSRAKSLPRDHKSRDTRSSIPRPQESPPRASPRKLPEAAPLSLGDIPPLRWKKATPARPVTPTTPAERSPSRIPQRARHDLRKKLSAPDLRRRNAIDGSDSQKSPKRPAGRGTGLKKKTSAPDLRRPAAEHTPGVGDCPPLPRHKKSSQSLRDFGVRDYKPEEIPRFMPINPADIKPIVTRPSAVVPPKLPTIIGCTPTRLQVKKKVEIRKVQETRTKKFMRVLKHTNFKSKWKGAAKNVKKQRIFMLKGMHSCMKVFRTQAQRKRLEMKTMPMYRFKERKRASIILSVPKMCKLPSIRSLSELIAYANEKERASHVKEPDIGEESEGSVYSEKGSKAKDDSAASPSKEGTGSQDTSNASVTVNRCGNRGIRPSLVPYQDWMEIFEASANPFTDAVTETEIPTEDSTENPSDDNILRASLIPFRDWFALFDSNRNPLNIDEPNQSRPNSPTVTFPRNSTLPSPFSSPLSSPRPSLLPYPHPPSHLYSIQLKETRRSVIEVKSSDNTHSSVSHCSTVLSSATGVMTSSSTDPFVERSAVEGEGLTQLESNVFAYPREKTAQEPSAQASSTVSPQEAIQSAEQETTHKDLAEDNMESSQSSKSRTDSGPSKIPRAGTKKRAPIPPVSRRSKGKAAASTPEQQTSLSTAARNESEAISESPQMESRQGFSGGIRLLDRITGHHTQTAASHAHPEPESPHQTVEDDDSSSVSSWGNFDPQELARQRPRGLTGENRPRPRYELFERYGPQLKIASSAERLLLGKDHDASESQASRSLSDPQGDKGMMPVSSREFSGTSHQSGQTRYESETPDSKRGENSPFGASRDVPNFCRPQVNYDNNPKRSDVSGREWAMQHRVTQGASSFVGADPANVPPVPRIPSMLKSDSKTSLKSNQPLTPPHGSPEYYEEMGTMHPPRSASLQAQAGSDFTPTQGSSADPRLKHKRSNLTFDDIIQDQEQLIEGESGARLPDSKSSRMLGGFRNIFSKSKAGATAKDPSGNKHSKNTTESSEARKSKPKWSKSSRSLRVEDISAPIPQIPAPSMMPSPSSYSSIPAPANRGRSEVYTPSFARPTQATRTRAAASAKQTSVAQEARMHRIKVLTPSTGSPSRSARIHKRSKVGISSPAPGTPAKFADSGQIGIENVNNYIDTLCARTCDEDDPTLRQKHMRLALDLQQHLSEYKRVDKETQELEALLSQKKIDKGLALNTLMHYHDQVRLELEED
ncbi:hypothetical protein PHISCL_08329 [Aspergillus sclerotialis]|uniref:Uncharacterized protein n=1 Tax=Aspergillus sclerotialis TaxID=2070753 RepID=A0A3A2Z8A8_9EURO|nr:hypothetical protein PHISCL_08329 [Aspergillus sclerotialis]